MMGDVLHESHVLLWHVSVLSLSGSKLRFNWGSKALLWMYKFLRLCKDKRDSSSSVFFSALYESETSEEVKNRGINAVSIRTNTARPAVIPIWAWSGFGFLSFSLVSYCSSTVAASVSDRVKTKKYLPRRAPRLKWAKRIINLSLPSFYY